MKKILFLLSCFVSLLFFSQFSQAVEYKNLFPKYYEYTKGFAIYSDEENKDKKCILHVSIKKKDSSFLSKNLFNIEKNINCNGYDTFVIVYNEINSENYDGKLNTLKIFYNMEKNENNSITLNIRYLGWSMGMDINSVDTIKLTENKPYEVKYCSTDPVLDGTVMSFNYQYKK